MIDKKKEAYLEPLIELALKISAKSAENLTTLSAEIAELQKLGAELKEIMKAAVPLPVYLLPEVTRVEVIDENGRSYTNWKPTNQTYYSFQDNNKTLKIFIKNL